jgi:hypothetical protein
MGQAEWAEDIARDLLVEALPRRWAHSQGVAAAARALAPVLGRHADIVIAAAWLHDIGYAPAVHGCGFHPLDGAGFFATSSARTRCCAGWWRTIPVPVLKLPNEASPVTCSASSSPPRVACRTH